MQSQIDNIIDQKTEARITMKQSSNQTKKTNKQSDNYIHETHMETQEKVIERMGSIVHSMLDNHL